jgi:hypothetical protein
MRDPERSIANGDATCAITDGNRGADGVGLGINAQERPSITIVNPDGAIVGRYAIL